MPNTNSQTILQMPGIVNKFVKQATGRESVSNIDMNFVSVGQDKKTISTNKDYDDIVSFANNSQLPLSVIAKITAIQAGTGDPAPDNERAITGWTGCKITRTGKNILNSTIKKLTTYVIMLGQEVSYSQSFEIGLAPGKYTISANLANPYLLYVKNSNATVDTRTNSPSKTPSVTFTVTEFDYFAFWIYHASGNANVADVLSYQLETGETETAHVPFKGNTYAITFPDPPETVYGGTLDVTTGILTVTHGYIDLGSLTWTKDTVSGETVFTAALSDGPELETFSALCSNYPMDNDEDYTDDDSGRCFGDATLHTSSIGIRDDTYAEGDVAAFKTAMNGVQLVYPLAEAETYELDPTEIKSLIGENNVFADTGDVSVSYTSYVPVP